MKGGTLAYMAPEQADPSRGPLNVATDVYGIGGILYNLLTGQPPVQSDDLNDALRQLRREELPTHPHDLDPEIPGDMSEICMKCLAKDPNNRFAAALDVADVLAESIVASQTGD